MQCNKAKCALLAGYDPITYEFDLALLYFEGPVAFGSHVRPVCLPAPGEEERPVRGQFGMGYVTGWGTLWEGELNTAGLGHKISARLRDWIIECCVYACGREGIGEANQ